MTFLTFGPSDYDNVISLSKTLFSCWNCDNWRDITSDHTIFNAKQYENTHDSFLEIIETFVSTTESEKFWEKNFEKKILKSW